jgi:hypothetical protein
MEEGGGGKWPAMRRIREVSVFVFRRGKLLMRGLGRRSI